MEREMILSGYCKCMDGSRTVIVEDGEADCFYPDCPHAPDCPIAKSIPSCPAVISTERSEQRNP